MNHNLSNHFKCAKRNTKIHKKYNAKLKKFKANFELYTRRMYSKHHYSDNIGCFESIKHQKLRKTFRIRHQILYEE